MVEGVRWRGCEGGLGGIGRTMAVGVEQGHDAGADGHAEALDPRERHMARVVWLRPVEGGEAPRRR